MDDDEDEREFSKSIVFGFFEQAEQTFTKMDEAVYALPLTFCHPAC
jgi:osomolarity two-component system phosphorelay intermediate protein YPD1